MTEDIFISKYRCKTIDEFIGNDNAKKETKEYYSNFISKIPQQKALLYLGPPGTGKTTLAILLAKTLGIPFEHINASNLRKYDAVRVGSDMMMTSVGGKVRLMILDECDRLDKRTQATLAKFVKKSKQPVIVIGNFKDKISKPLKNLCNVVKFKKPTNSETISRLQQLDLNIEDEILHKIVDDSDTIRTALNMLQSYIDGGDVSDGSRIDSFDKLDLLKESVINGIQNRQKMTPDEIVVYLHDSGVDPKIISDLDIINGRSREIGYDQWRYFFSYFDQVRHNYIVNFPYTWMFIGKMKSRKKKPEVSVDVEKLSKKEKEGKKVKSLSRFW